MMCQWLGPLVATHFLILSRREPNIYLKLKRLPGGPARTFWMLLSAVVSSLCGRRKLEKHLVPASLLLRSSSGSQGMHMKLMASTFQNLFHRIGVHKVNLNTIKRCLLVNYNAYSQELESSHYMFPLQSHSCGRKSWDEEASPEVLRHEPPAQQQELLATGVVLADREVEPDGKHDITELPRPATPPPRQVVTRAAPCGSSRVLSSPPILGLGLPAGHAHPGGC